MKTTTTDGKSFTLTAETVSDYQLINALDMNGMHLRCMLVGRPLIAAVGGGSISSMATLEIDPKSPYSIRAEAGRQALRSLGNLLSLGMVEAAQHRHISPAPTQPQAQEELPASLVQLQVMLQTLGDVVLQQKAVLKEMRSAHSAPGVVEPGIVMQGGAA